MQCPVCKTVALVMSERHGVEIDYCPQCRGVWLDRGELDKIIERSSAAPVSISTHSAPQQVAPSHQQHHDNYRQQHHDNYRSQHQPYKKKREGFLADLFDFD